MFWPIIKIIKSLKSMFLKYYEEERTAKNPIITQRLTGLRHNLVYQYFTVLRVLAFVTLL
jgi:hypothetical protein